jgi:hypothetical protein
VSAPTTGPSPPHLIFLESGKQAGRKKFLMLVNWCGERQHLNLLNNRPHPGPLLRGEGEVVPASLEKPAAGFTMTTTEQTKNVNAETPS